MDIKTPAEKLEPIIYGDSSFGELVDFLKKSKNDGNHHLCLFLGHYDPDKRRAVKQLGDELGLSVKETDFNDVVSRSEKETIENLDRFFAGNQSEDSILYFTNGARLCGSYTGYTKSKIKYATPQERYFLNKVKEYKAIVIIDITEYSDADQTIRRSAQSIVTFPLPKSPYRRFMWHLKNYSLHGFDIKTKRPEVYGEAEGSKFDSN